MKKTYQNYFTLPVDSKMVTWLVFELVSYYRLSKLFLFNQQNPMTYLSIAAVSELFAVTASYPYRLLRTRMQDLHHARIGTLDMFIRTLR